LSPPTGREFRYIIWNKQLAALDSGEEIPFPIAGRPCLVRLNPNPTLEQPMRREK
jgi:hypothetical protein